MAKQQYTNNAETILSGGIGASATTIVLAVGTGASFPSLSGSDYFVGTVYELNGSGVEINHEIVKVTGRTADTLTVVRAFDNTAARAFPSSVAVNPSQVVYFSLRWTAYAAGNNLTVDDNLASLASASTARTNLGLGSIATQDADNVTITGGTINDLAGFTVVDSSVATAVRANLDAAILGTNDDITSLTSMTGGISSPTFIDFNTSTSGTDAVARMKWNDSDGTVELGLKGGNVTLQVGQESVQRCLNNSGTNIPNGSVVYVTGASGQRITIALANANSETTSKSVLGLATEDIANGDQGYITTEGVVHNINTNSFTVGDTVWLSTTSGQYTNVQPTSPNHGVRIGYCTRVGVGDGHIYVKVDNGYELDELHDVSITSKANNDSLFYNSTSGVWTNRTPSAARTALGVGTGDSPSFAGLTISTFTAGSVVFAGASGVYSQDNANFFWDDTNNRLGIGTASPATQLHLFTAAQATARIASTSYSMDILVQESANTAAIRTNTATPIVFLTNTTERMRIDSSGNLGLGVTPSAWASNRKVLQISGLASAALALNGTNAVSEMYFNSYLNASAVNTYATTSYAGLYDFNSSIAGGFVWKLAPSGTAGNPITFTQAMTLNSSGNLGLGYTSYTAALAVSGNVGIGISSADAKLRVVGAGTNPGALRIGYNGTSVNYYDADTNIFRNGAATESMRIDSTGNVLVTGSGGLGYGTGSGGAVTQATSRTTGVTLNKTNGAITLVSAAGLATYQSFTVTNSTVAATDVIHVCQKSGTDKYIILVTNVAAGSFQITFATTGGVTTEQPVFNFAVIKAVTA